MILFGEVIITSDTQWRYCGGVCGICMSAPICGQLKMVIYVQTLKVAKGHKRGAAFVRLSHFTHLRIFLAVVTADEINFQRRH